MIKPGARVQVVGQRCLAPKGAIGTVKKVRGVDRKGRTLLVLMDKSKGSLPIREADLKEV